MAKIKKPALIRALEIIPGTLTWLTLIGAPILAYYHPVWISLYIILFDLYWFLKGANVAMHLMHSYSALKTHNGVDWLDWLERIRDRAGFEKFLVEKIHAEPRRRYKALYREQIERLRKVPSRDMDWKKFYHLIVFPTYNEDLEILEASVKSYAQAKYPKEKLLFVIAIEERAGQKALDRAKYLEEKYAQSFDMFLIAPHPDGLPGEVRGKAGNMNFACEMARQEITKRGISYEDVIVSTFDSDTIIQPNFFAYLTYAFLTERKPHQASYQPMPVYHNNIWDTPAVARVIAVSSSFWQLIEASRPDRLVTFASHSMSFKTLVEVGYFRKDSINEDSFIFWQCFMHFNGDYRTRPLFTTVSMDAVLGESYWGTMVAQYKQKRRWAYGVSQISYVVSEALKNKSIPLWKRFIYPERLVEGHYFWATASIMIAILGWLPLIFGGDRFGSTVLAYNLPTLTRFIMSVATFFLIFSVYVNWVMLPTRPRRYGKWKNLSMILQWLFSPIVASVFGSVPAIDAQTKLMFGRYMESFYVTPKFRKGASEPETSKLINKIV